MAQKKKLQVFVSSTFEDLREDRQAAVEAILTAKHIPAGMELFTSGDELQMNVIKRWIDQSDVYLLILGGRYGSIDPKSGKSYTHLEFEYAVEQKKALFSIIINDDALEARVKARGRGVIEQENKTKLDEFRKAAGSNMVRFWSDAKDIKLAVLETLGEYSERSELVGWVPGNESVDAGAIAEEIARLNKENSELKKQISMLSDNGEYKENRLHFDDSDANIMLRDYIQNRNLELISKQTIVINYTKVDDELGLKPGMTKRCLPTALQGSGYSIVSKGVNVAEVGDIMQRGPVSANFDTY